tara:strand:- start:645 stop:1766 length:1122 start_codon:yes stop_codon:yes gene_type:complete
MIEWDRQSAIALLEEYKKFWGPEKNPSFGITGNPDANTGKINSKSVYLTVLSHGISDMSRSNAGFIGGNVILTTLLTFLQKEVFTEEDLKLFEYMEKDLKGVESRENLNPANTLFRTMIKFEPPESEDDEPVIERGWVRGHFLTEAYWEYRTWKAKGEGSTFPSSKPKKEWYSLPTGSEGKGPSNKAKPPLWQAILGPKNSLRELVTEVKKLVEAQGPGTTPVRLLVNANLGPRTAESIASISGLKNAIREVMADGRIYTKGRRFPVKSRLNDEVGKKTFTVSQTELQVLVQNCTVSIDGERLSLDDIVNYEKINNVSLKFPKSNITLNSVVRAVMGEEMKTYKVPGSLEGDGITLKQIDAMQAFSNLMKVLR